MPTKSAIVSPTATRPVAGTFARALLGCGLVAGPLWVGVVLVQMATRPGFDIRRHAVSQLSLGDLGWVQMANFIISGLLVVAFAIGVRRTLARARGGTWGALLLGIYGAGLVGAGMFRADPGNGFPPGTPDVTGQISSHGLMHLIFAAIAFVSIIAASAIVFARRYRGLAHPGRMAYSIFTGAYFLATWIGLIATGARFATVNVAFAIAVLLAWAWLTALAVELVRVAKTGVERLT